MNDGNRYETWQQRRRRVEVDPDFADRVMEQVHRCERRPEHAAATADRGAGSPWHRWAVAALLLAAVAVEVLHLGSVIAMVLYATTAGF